MLRASRCLKIFREVITHPPASTCCPDCGGALRQFGEDVSEQLERIPASFKVVQHVRPNLACGACEQVVGGKSMW